MNNSCKKCLRKWNNSTKSEEKPMKMEKNQTKVMYNFKKYIHSPEF